MLFHEYLKTLRLMREVGLRSLAHDIGMDVGNYSRIERGLLKPPQKTDFIDKVRKVLKLSKEEVERLSASASLANGRIPEDVAEDMKAYEYLPVLLRTIANKQLTDEQLKDLTERINKEY